MNAQFPKEQSEEGEFQRQEDAFRDWIKADGSNPFKPEPDRYHLYVSLACPWASRTVIVRKLQGLESAISMTVVDPVRDERGWAFRDGPGFSKDPINHFAFLSEAYHATDPSFDGRVTVPVLWDKKLGRIVNNSEDDICRMLNDSFRPWAKHPVDLFPAELAGEQAKVSADIYERVNNGVYRAGFATAQRPYERGCRSVFEALDLLEKRLGQSRFLMGNRITEADWRLFCTLVRFDAVYYGHFKCNLRRIIDYPNLHGYLLDLYQLNGIAETVDIDQIKRHYYYTHDDINPTRIIPIGPILDFQAKHNRDRFGAIELR